MDLERPEGVIRGIGGGRLECGEACAWGQAVVWVAEIL